MPGYGARHLSEGANSVSTMIHSLASRRPAALTLDRQVAESADRMAPSASVALTVTAWLSTAAYGVLCGVVAAVAVLR